MSNERNEEDISTSQEQEGPLSRRYLVRVLVFVFVRLVRHAGSATSVARNAHFLGTIIDRSVGLVGCSRPWREWDLLPGKDDGVKLVSWAGNNDIMDNGLVEGVNVRVGRQDSECKISSDGSGGFESRVDLCAAEERASRLGVIISRGAREKAEEKRRRPETTRPPYKFKMD
ncbi:hypothetical protein BGY98DRAFT_931451 [Russula aff. rugulosa BPL654]|nr:hypothetical protein BGY98DRAFT_931451 [Russula aff. rugulosa BPL654]